MASNNVMIKKPGEIKMF